MLSTEAELVFVLCLAGIDRLSLDEQHEVQLKLNRTVVQRLVDKAAETARARGTFLDYQGSDG